MVENGMSVVKPALNLKVKNKSRVVVALLLLVFVNIYYQVLFFPKINGLGLSVQYLGTLDVIKGGTGLTNLTIGSFLVGNGTSVSLTPTSTFETTANAASVYLTKATYNAFTGTLQDLAYLNQVDVTTTSVTGILPITKGGTGLTTLTAGNFLVGNGGSISFTPTATFETTANAASVYLTKATYNAFTGTLQDLAYLDQVNLTTTSVTGTLPILNGGTAKTSFNTTQLIYGQFSQNANLTFDETVLKSPTVCGTIVCGTTILEGGQTLTSKYYDRASTGVFETTANAQSTYLAKTNFNTWSGSLALSAGLKDVDLTTPPTNNQVLKWNDTAKRWKAADDSTGVGGGTPGGNNTNVQINFESNFSGNAGLTYNLDTSTLRAQYYSNLPSGDPIWNARQLSGIPLVSGLLDPTPQNGDVLTYLVSPSVPTTGWYYAQPGGSTAGGNDTQIQFNNGGAFSGSPALIWQNSTSSLISKQLSATTVSAGTIHVGGSDGYIRNNNGSIGISSIGGSVSISGTGSVSLQGLSVNAAAWPEAGSNNGVVFYSDAGNSLLIARLNGQALNGSRDFFGSQPQGYLVASYLGSSTPAMQIDPYYATNYAPLGLPNYPQNKEVLIYNDDLYPALGTVPAWTWERLSLAGGYLSDVSAVAATTSNQALVYDTTGAKWKPGYTITYSTSAPTGGADGDIHIKYFTSGDSPAEIGVACSDETTNLTTGTAKATFRMPYAMYVNEVRANVNTAPSGSTIIVDVNKNASSIFSTRVTIDSAEKTSKTAATAAVITTNSLADDDEITIDIDQIGSTTAGKGLKVWLIGYRL